LTSHQIAQIGIAKFRLPPENPINADFVSNLDRINSIAERQPGFVWRLVGNSNDAVDVKASDDPNIVINMAVWTDMESLGEFAFRNVEHRKIMMRRHEWFEKIQFYLALWWVDAGHIPTVEEGKSKLELLAKKGPTPAAFTFGKAFDAHGRKLFK
jgi:hypothetical protein